MTKKVISKDVNLVYGLFLFNFSVISQILYKLLRIEKNDFLNYHLDVILNT